MRLRVLYPVVALISLAGCSASAEAVVRDDAADRLKCHPREIAVSGREDIALGAYQATGCGAVAIFRCHNGAGGIVDCLPDDAVAEGPALGNPAPPVTPPPAAHAAKPTVSSNTDGTDS